jgi:hypothetical protein
MGANDILSIVRRQPFQPFRIVLTSGQTYDIRHPDMALVTRGSVHVSVPPPSEPEDPAKDVVYLSLFHVMKIVFLPEPATGTANSSQN